jgi:hypothetical protein
MGTQGDFGALLIAALEEAVAYKQGRLDAIRVDRVVMPGGCDTEPETRSVIS